MSDADVNAIVSYIVSLIRRTVPSSDALTELTDFLLKELKIPKAGADTLGRIVLQLLARKEPKDTLGDVVRTITATTTAKRGGETVVYIVVGPQISGYTPDIAFIPGVLYVHAEDKVKWQLSNGGDFEIKFNKSPFDKAKDTFLEDELGTIAKSVSTGQQFHYNLSRLYNNRWPWTSKCPEIIIDK